MGISGHEGVRDEVRMRGREEQGEEKKHPQSVTSYNIVINQRVIERAKVDFGSKGYFGMRYINLIYSSRSNI